MGLKQGDRVGIWGGNYYEWVVCQFATAMAGMILVNINPAYKSHELRFALMTVGVRALVTPHKFKTTSYISVLNDVSSFLQFLRVSSRNQVLVNSY